MRELLEYDGSISMISRWAQELLGYHFTVIHRSARMMRDVDALTRRFGPMITRHMMIAMILSARDRAKRPEAYEAKTFKTSKKASVFGPSNIDSNQDSPILVNDYIDNTLQHLMTDIVEEDTVPTEIMQLATSPIMLVHAAQISCHGLVHEKTDIRMRTLDIPDSLELNWLCINDITGASLHYTSAVADKIPFWTSHNIFTSTDAAKIFDLLHGKEMR